MYGQEFIWREYKVCRTGSFGSVSTFERLPIADSSHLNLTVPAKWTREPIDTWIVKGSSHAVSCEADGFPDPIVVLFRKSKDNCQEVSRGIKTTTFNLTSNLITDREQEIFVCETSNEGGKLEKEFKIFAHGQFPCLFLRLQVSNFEAFQSNLLNLIFPLFHVLKMNISCRNEALCSSFVRKGGSIR